MMIGVCDASFDPARSQTVWPQLVSRRGTYNPDASSQNSSMQIGHSRPLACCCFGSGSRQQCVSLLDHLLGQCLGILRAVFHQLLLQYLRD